MNTQFERICAKIYDDAFNALANAKPFEHAWSPGRSVCMKCGITEEQAVELDVTVCNVE